MLHAGQLNPERPLDTYLRGLRIFLERNGEAETARTLFLGGHYDADVDRVEAAGLSPFVEFSPSCPHHESVAALLRARVLLLLEQDSERGELILPGKIFEYLRAGRPILAVVPNDGAAAQLIRSMDAGWVADPSRPETVAEGLERLLQPGATGPGIETTRRFERRALAAELARLLDAIV
ncbi:MAG: glycosyltransferase [Candidatus Eisenbacteria bacterium]